MRTVDHYTYAPAMRHLHDLRHRKHKSCRARHVVDQNQAGALVERLFNRGNNVAGVTDRKRNLGHSRQRFHSRRGESDSVVAGVVAVIGDHDFIAAPERKRPDHCIDAIGRVTHKGKVRRIHPNQLRERTADMIQLRLKLSLGSKKANGIAFQFIPQARLMLQNNRRRGTE